MQKQDYLSVGMTTMVARWKCCGLIFTLEQEFIGHVCTKHEEEGLERWLNGEIFNE